jgi:glutamate-1-semialdehyde 2,1-aminomutase/spore coat polysaccharide biosynthesis protein SpsF
MTVTAVIIARMGSTRLPGKVLMPLGRDGRPVLHWVYTAARAAAGVDQVVVATTGLVGDDPIRAWCARHDIPCYQGSENDVLDRVYCAAAEVEADIVVRITGDCPFIDPYVIGEVVRLQKETGADYVSNIDPRTWPDGLDVEAFTFDSLAFAHEVATRPIDRECVTTFIQRNRSRLPAAAVVCPIPGLHKERWVLDTKNDYRFCSAIANELHGPPARYLDILAVLDRKPELRKINRHHPMNERYYEAIANEPIIPRSYERSQAQFERAHKVIPLAAQTFSKSFVQFPQPSPLFLSHGQGGVCWDIDGNEFVDLVSALLPNILGYRDADVDRAVRTQLASGASFSLSTELEAQLAEKLTRLIPCAEMVRFGKNGSDVTTAAIRLARAYTGRDRVLICGGYHGWHDWSIAGAFRDLGVPTAVKELTARLDFSQCPPDDLSNVAAIIVEPEGNPQYLQYLRNVCDKEGPLLIFDEVITGFRFALGGAQEYYGVTPDLACFGKAMANGMPLSALVGRADIMRKLEPPNPCVFFSGTFGGETLSLAASIATIAKMERENVIDKIWETGETLRSDVTDLIRAHGLGDVIGLYGQAPLKRISMKAHENATVDQLWALFRKEMIASGTLIIGSHNICYAHTQGDIKRVLKSYDHTLAIMREALDHDNIARRLEGATIAPMVRAS